MHTALKCLSLGTAALWLATSAAAQGQPMPAHTTQPSKGFDQLKPLVGEWNGQTASGKATHVSYQIVSGGTALLERLRTGDEPEMVTVYTPDGEHLAMTHYCSVGNQPQMRTEAVTGDVKQFSFSYVGATNLSGPKSGHMHHLTVTMQDRDHFTQEWTWTQDGQSHTEVFRFARKA